MKTINNEQIQDVKEKQSIYGQGAYYDYNNNENRLNDNVIIVGSSGTGKTTSIVEPNILQCNGSVIVSDAKGNLYRRNKERLESKGYVVKHLNFVNPEESTHYDPICYLRTTQDIMKLAHMLVDANKNVLSNKDPYWDDCSEILLSSIIGYILENKEALSKTTTEDSKVNLPGVIEFVKYATETLSSNQTVLDNMFDLYEKHHPKSWALSQYRSIRVKSDKTWTCITTSLSAKFRAFSSREVQSILMNDDIDIKSLGHQKTAIFVTVSDNDRSMDLLANLFYTQAINELCLHADYDKSCVGERLPIPVQFILDDFATNCKVEEMPRIISSVRSRNISIMMMIQAESQLFYNYKEDAKTILANCDTYVYLGTNELETVTAVSQRADMSKRKVMSLPVGKCIIFRRGDEPLMTDTFRFMDWEYIKEMDEQVKELMNTKPNIFSYPIKVKYKILPLSKATDNEEQELEDIFLDDSELFE